MQHIFSKIQRGKLINKKKKSEDKGHFLKEAEFDEREKRIRS